MVVLTVVEIVVARVVDLTVVVTGLHCPVALLHPPGQAVLLVILTQFELT